MTEFDRLISEAQQAAFRGWDFSYLRERWRQDPLPWTYEERVRLRLPRVHTMLDMGTGGGERLAALAPPPPEVWATESYEPNVPVAHATLAPLGVRVVRVRHHEALPVPSDYYDLVVNRHEKFVASEVARALKPGGEFITQQVGERHTLELNEFLYGTPAVRKHSRFQKARGHLADAGLHLTEQREAAVRLAFHDIGAVVYYLNAVPWQLPGFNVDRFRTSLMGLHEHIRREGSFIATAHYYLLVAQKPGNANDHVPAMAGPDGAP